MSNNNKPTRNSEQRQHRVFLKPSGDWSLEPGDGMHHEPEVFFMAGGAIGIEAWASRSQSSALQQCKAWLSAALRRIR